jgi:hypothetical protein
VSVADDSASLVLGVVTVVEEAEYGLKTHKRYDDDTEKGVSSPELLFTTISLLPTIRYLSDGYHQLT